MKITALAIPAAIAGGGLMSKDSGGAIASGQGSTEMVKCGYQVNIDPFMSNQAEAESWKWRSGQVRVVPTQDRRGVRRCVRWHG